jgi:hypothetical protein
MTTPALTPAPAGSAESWLEQALTLAERSEANGGVPQTAALVRRRVEAGLSGTKRRISWKEAVAIGMDVLPPTTRACAFLSEPLLASVP